MKTLISLCLLFAGVSAFAQMDGGSYVRRSIVCESLSNRPAACRTGLDRTFHVQLVNQLSHAPCVEGQSFQIQRDIIQVSNGCRAEFSADGMTNQVQQGDQVLGTMVSLNVTCESEGGRTATCQTGLQRVFQVIVGQQLSHSACVEGQSFQVVNGNMIQVSAGCRAQFIVNGLQ